ncbi:MAG: hypothetical protein JSW50_11235 [Candidatus Latescibacterota bacterium]|nr:MAG: hypothetical protein JSW50_11235 [Candidatus Latescibacterota bacterium]
MEREFEYLEDKEIVIVRATGSYELSAEIDTVKKIASKLKEHNCSRLLIDFRAAHIAAKTMDIFDRPKAYGDHGIERSIRAAIVCKELSNDLRFYETVCLNRGWSVNIFDDYDAGIEWLTK